MEADAPAVSEPVGVLLTDTVVLGVDGGIPVPLRGEPVSVTLCADAGVALLLRETLPVLEADAPNVTEPVGLCDRVELPLSVVVGDCEAVPVPDCVGELDGVPVPVCVGVREPLNDALPLFDAEAPDVREAVGLCDCVELPLSVEDGVCAGVPVPVCVGELDGVPVPVCVGVGEPLYDALSLLDAEAPAVKDAVLEADTVPLALSVELGVAAAVPLPVPLLVPVLEAEAPSEGVGVALGEGVGLGEAVLLEGAEAVVPLLAEAAPEAVEEPDKVAGRVLCAVDVAVAVSVLLTLLLPVVHALEEALGTNVLLLLDDAVAEAVAAVELDGAPVVDTLPLQVGVKSPEPEGVAVMLAHVLSVPNSVTLPERMPLAVDEPVKQALCVDAALPAEEVVLDAVLE